MATKKQDGPSTTKSPAALPAAFQVKPGDPKAMVATKEAILAKPSFKNDKCLGEMVKLAWMLAAWARYDDAAAVAEAVVDATEPVKGSFGEWALGLATWIRSEHAPSDRLAGHIELVKQCDERRRATLARQREAFGKGPSFEESTREALTTWIQAQVAEARSEKKAQRAFVLLYTNLPALAAALGTGRTVGVDAAAIRAELMSALSDYRSRSA